MLKGMSKQKICCHQHLENQVPNAHIQNILSLPVIAGTNPVRINEF